MTRLSEYILRVTDVLCLSEAWCANGSKQRDPTCVLASGGSDGSSTACALSKKAAKCVKELHGPEQKHANTHRLFIKLCRDQ